MNSVPGLIGVLFLRAPLPVVWLQPPVASHHPLESAISGTEAMRPLGVCRRPTAMEARAVRDALDLAYCAECMFRSAMQNGTAATQHGESAYLGLLGMSCAELGLEAGC